MPASRTARASSRPRLPGGLVSRSRWRRMSAGVSMAKDALAWLLALARFSAQKGRYSLQPIDDPWARTVQQVFGDSHDPGRLDRGEVAPARPPHEPVAQPGAAVVRGEDEVGVA